MRNFKLPLILSLVLFAGCTQTIVLRDYAAETPPFSAKVKGKKVAVVFGIDAEKPFSAPAGLGKIQATDYVKSITQSIATNLGAGKPGGAAVVESSVADTYPRDHDYYVTPGIHIKISDPWGIMRCDVKIQLMLMNSRYTVIANSEATANHHYIFNGQASDRCSKAMHEALLQAEEALFDNVK